MRRAPIAFSYSREDDGPNRLVLARSSWCRFFEKPFENFGFSRQGRKLQKLIFSDGEEAKAAIYRHDDSGQVFARDPYMKDTLIAVKEINGYFQDISTLYK